MGGGLSQTSGDYRIKATGCGMQVLEEGQQIEVLEFLPKPMKIESKRISHPRC